MPSTVLFLDTDPQDRSLVQKHFPDAQMIEGALQGKELIAACKDAEAISTFIRSPFTADVISALPKLKLISTRSVGYDHIDTAACASQGITVCNVPDYGSHVIAEHVFALLLSTLRHIPEGDRRTEKGVFDYHGLRGIALKGKTIGIVGTGKIGRAVAHIAFGFGMKILAVDVCRVLELEENFGVKYVSLEELLAQSDIVSLHVPALPETNHMIDAKAFAAMKPGVILVNTARGSLIDSSALHDALENGKVAYALLDVLEHESNFAEDKSLVTHPRVVSTPHIAFYADDSMRKMYEDSIESIKQWQRGETPTHIVKPVEKVCDLPGVKKK